MRPTAADRPSRSVWIRTVSILAVFIRAFSIRAFSIRAAAVAALILAIWLAALPSGPARAAATVAETLDGVPAVAAAMAAVGIRDWTAADLAATGAGRNAEIARDLVAWHRLRARDGTFADYRTFLARRGDWPGLPLLRARGERSIPLNGDPDAVIGYFDGHAPQTGAGAVALVRALAARGDAEGAARAAARLWRDLTLDETAEAALLDRFAVALAGHHIARLDRQLWEGEAMAAARMLPLVPDDWRRLAEARLALRAGTGGVDALIAAVPDNLAADPGLAWERFRWRVGNGLRVTATDLLLARSTSAESLGRPESWAAQRANLARAAMRAGDADLAYRIAANHHLAEGAAFADLEWLAGFVALRGRGDAAAALRHFHNLRLSVTTPISLARAGYWEGRAHEALGEAESARAAYAFGAEHQTAFYGLLAAERAGLPFDADLASDGDLPDWRQAGLAGSSVLRAALLLHATGDRMLARRFLLHLGESQDAAGHAALAALALDLEEPNFAVLLAKQAAGNGVILPATYFPVSDLVPDGLAVPRDLALAIARRESEFDPQAISPAGARGLMQLMPGTAELMAGEMDESFDRNRLTTDPGYNARLGAGYLARLIDEFGNSPVLVAAGYNAGPGRPRRWVQELGDPRDPAVDPVDWIEHVPFAETRNYIMRVLESLVVYRARLHGAEAAPRLSTLLRGG